MADAGGPPGGLWPWLPGVGGPEGPRDPCGPKPDGGGPFQPGGGGPDHPGGGPCMCDGGPSGVVGVGG